MSKTIERRANTTSTVLLQSQPSLYELEFNSVEFKGVYHDFSSEDCEVGPEKLRSLSVQR